MKGDLIHINPDKIDYIHIGQPREYKYQWFEGEQPIYKFFNLIKVQDGKKAGWSNSKVDYYRYSTEGLLMDNFFFEEDHVSGKQWYKKPYMKIVMGRNSLGEYFDNVEEAKAFANKIVKHANSQFQILIEKN